MRLEPYYAHYNRNVGRIKSIEGDNITASICAGHGGGDMVFLRGCCRQGLLAEPRPIDAQIDDRVLLCVDGDGEIGGFFLMKLKKRQEHPKVNHI